MNTAIMPSMDAPPVAACDTDTGLLLRYRSDGDRRHLIALWDLHHEVMWRAARRLSGNDACADDALQDAAMDLLRAAGSWSGQGSVRSWLVAIAANAARRRLRAETRRKRHEAAVPTPTPVQAVDADLRARAMSSLAVLPDHHRLSVAMRFLDRMEFADIAAALDAKEKTVRVWVDRGLARLRKELALEADAGMAGIALLLVPDVPLVLPAGAGSGALETLAHGTVAKVGVGAGVGVATAAGVVLMAGLGYAALRPVPPLPTPPPPAPMAQVEPVVVSSVTTAVVAPVVPDLSGRLSAEDVLALTATTEVRHQPVEIGLAAFGLSEVEISRVLNLCDTAARGRGLVDETTLPWGTYRVRDLLNSYRASRWEVRDGYILIERRNEPGTVAKLMAAARAAAPEVRYDALVDLLAASDREALRATLTLAVEGMSEAVDLLLEQEMLADLVALRQDATAAAVVRQGLAAADVRTKRLCWWAAAIMRVDGVPEATAPLPKDHQERLPVFAWRLAMAAEEIFLKEQDKISERIVEYCLWGGAPGIDIDAERLLRIGADPLAEQQWISAGVRGLDPRTTAQRRRVLEVLTQPLAAEVRTALIGCLLRQGSPALDAEVRRVQAAAPGGSAAYEKAAFAFTRQPQRAATREAIAAACDAIAQAPDRSEEYVNRVEALARLDGPGVMPALLAMQRPGNEVWWARGLCRAWRDEGVPILLTAFHGEDAQRRREAIWELARSRHPEALRAVAEAQQSPSAVDREDAIVNVGWYHGDLRIALRAAVNDPSPSVRRTALAGLVGHLHWRSLEGRPVLQALSAMVADPAPEVRRRVVQLAREARGTCFDQRYDQGHAIPQAFLRLVEDVDAVIRRDALLLTVGLGGMDENELQMPTAWWQARYQDEDSRVVAAALASRILVMNGGRSLYLMPAKSCMNLFNNFRKSSGQTVPEDLTEAAARIAAQSGHRGLRHLAVAMIDPTSESRISEFDGAALDLNWVNNDTVPRSGPAPRADAGAGTWNITIGTKPGTLTIGPVLHGVVRLARVEILRGGVTLDGWDADAYLDAEGVLQVDARGQPEIPGNPGYMPDSLAISPDGTLVGSDDLGQPSPGQARRSEKPVIEETPQPSF